MAWTTPITFTSGQLVTAAIANEQISGNAALLKTSVNDSGALEFANSTELTIASGVITPTQNLHSVDTESSAASDDVNTITVAGDVGEGFVLTLQVESDARTVVLKNATAGAANLDIGADITLDESYTTQSLIYDGSNWKTFSYAAAPAFASISPLTTRGDLLYGSSGTVTGARLAVGAANQVLTSDGTDVAWAAAGTGVNRQNANPLIINGNMAISQRATSATGKSTSGYYTVDRWYADISSAGTWTQTQTALTSGDAFGDGFANSLKMDLTGGAGSAGSAAYVHLKTSLEGFDLQMFKKGTSAAETFTVAFWVKATKTGTNILELVDGNSRHCSTAYTVSVSDTWEYKVVNVPKDTTGTFADDNSAELQVIFWMVAGSDFTSGTLATAWAATSAVNRAVGQVNNSDDLANNFEITGVQLEVDTYTSSTLPPFQHESFSNNLSRCERYFVGDMKVGAVGMSQGTGQAAVAHAQVVFPTTMRASPTVTGSITAVNGVSTLQTSQGLDEYAAVLGVNSNTTTNPNRVYWSGDANFAAEL